MDGCGQKLPWPNWRLHPARGLEELRKTVRNPRTFAAPTDSRTNHTANTRDKRHCISGITNQQNLHRLYITRSTFFSFSLPLFFSICRSYVPSRHLYQTHNPQLCNTERYNSAMLHNTRQSP
jgi:hypothetical protein